MRPSSSLADIGGGFDITFHGVRGSTPCHGEAVARYGGNTSCVSVDVPGHDPVLFDLGTGLRYFGERWPAEQIFRGTCLLSHLHWDHVQGLPFFQPLLRHGARLDVYVPPQDDGRGPGDALCEAIHPPMFPVGLSALPGTIGFRAVGDEEFEIGAIKVMSRLVPHIGNTLGYRLTWEGRSVAYLSDHQQPALRDFTLAAGAQQLCEGVDVLIHDAQYTQHEFATKADWGHCTIEYAIWVARTCGVQTLVLYHHDPSHSDDLLDALVSEARTISGDVDVIAAREGMTMRVGG